MDFLYFFFRIPDLVNFLWVKLVKPFFWGTMGVFDAQMGVGFLVQLLFFCC